MSMTKAEREDLKIEFKEVVEELSKKVDYLATGKYTKLEDDYTVLLEINLLMDDVVILVDELGGMTYER